MRILAAKRLILPLSYRDFRLLWIGQTISALGNPFQVVALVWLVLKLKGSPLDLATMMLALTLPQAIVTLAGGVLIDRFDVSGLVANFAGIQVLFMAAGIVTVFGALLGFMVPSLRHLD